MTCNDKKSAYDKRLTDAQPHGTKDEHVHDPYGVQEGSSNGIDLAPAELQDDDRASRRSVTRRCFIAGGCSAAALCAVGPLLAALSQTDALLRPPGAQDENALEAACLHCWRCISICPENCLVATKVEEGLIAYRLPSFDFTKGFCTFCGKCQEVCPTGAIGDFDPESDKIGVAQVDSDFCVAYKNPGSCARCIEACDWGALSVSNGLPVVSESLCNGCGACVYVCPSASYTSYTSIDSKHRGINVEVS